MSRSSPWFPFAKPRPGVRARLFAFPYAGGGANVFRGWQERIPAGIELLAVQYPGRETRLREAPFTRVEDLVHALLPEVRGRLDLPFVFLGYSLGSLIAFELARALGVRGERTPERLFVVAAGAPHTPRIKPEVRDLSDAEFVAELGRLGGTPPEVLAHQELLELFLPVLRADFCLSETYSCRPEDAIAAPITAARGVDDAEVELERFAGWPELTRADCESIDLPGAHFLTPETEELVLAPLRRTLDGLP